MNDTKINLVGFFLFLFAVWGVLLIVDIKKNEHRERIFTECVKHATVEVCYQLINK